MDIASSSVDNLQATVNYKFANLGSLKDFFLMLAPMFAMIVAVFGSIYTFVACSNQHDTCKTADQPNVCKGQSQLDFATNLAILFIGFSAGAYSIEYMLVNKP
jgi:hypothetical protein